MITKIIAKNFKGLSFDQEVGKKTIFIGPNGAGKTARTQALTLALMGYIPGSSKLNEEIIKNYATGDILVVGFELSGTIFERAWAKDAATGSVKEKFQLNKKPCKKEAYIQKLGECGAPKLLDLSVFMALSDQKKIDFFLALYPVETNISELESLIESNRKSILALEEKARTSEKAAATLIASKATMKLPAGSLAETVAAIEKMETDIFGKEKELSDIIAENKTEEAREKERQRSEAALKKQKQAAELEKAAAVNIAKKDAEEKASALNKALDSLQNIPKESLKKDPLKETMKVDKDLIEKVVIILRSVLDTIESSGCEVCAAKMLIKKEMKKYAGN